MGAEVETVHRMWCDGCSAWLKDDHFSLTQVVNFTSEIDMYHQANKQGWHFDHDTASWYCPECQEQLQHGDTK